MDSADRERVGTSAQPVVTDRVVFHEPTGTYRTRFDSVDRPASEAVVSAVSAATGIDALELPPIYDAVDPDALCSLFGSPTTGSGRFRGTVTFEYADNLVTVDSRGSIEVDPLGESRPPAE